MSEQNESPQEPSLEQLQLMGMVIELREGAFRQIIYGLGWWIASAVAMYFALAESGESVYWYGGALGSLFHWFRAFKMITATYELGVKKLMMKEGILIAFTALIAISSAAKIVPEYLRMDVPTIGTCWSDKSGGMSTPVACWSDKANARAIKFVENLESCPANTTFYFSPSARESRYTCLEAID